MVPDYPLATIWTSLEIDVYLYCPVPLGFEILSDWLICAMIFFFSSLGLYLCLLRRYGQSFIKSLILFLFLYMGLQKLVGIFAIKPTLESLAMSLFWYQDFSVSRLWLFLLTFLLGFASIGTLHVVMSLPQDLRYRHIFGRLRATAFLIVLFSAWAIVPVVSFIPFVDTNANLSLTHLFLYLLLASVLYNNAVHVLCLLFRLYVPRSRLSQQELEVAAYLEEHLPDKSCRIYYIQHGLVNALAVVSYSTGEKSILFGRDLLTQLTPDEALAILVHETGHLQDSSFLPRLIFIHYRRFQIFTVALLFAHTHANGIYFAMLVFAFLAVASRFPSTMKISHQMEHFADGWVKSYSPYLAVCLSSALEKIYHLNGQKSEDFKVDYPSHPSLEGRTSRLNAK